MFKPISIVCILVFLAAFAKAADTLIWIEGEQAVKRQLVDNAGLNDVNPDELSGGKWICSFSHEKEPTGTAEYAVEIPAAGRYHLWVAGRGRHGPGLSPGRREGRRRRGDRQGEGRDPRLRRWQPVLSADGPPGTTRARVELTRGKHAITWYLGGLKEKDRCGGMDCFVLTTGDVHAQRQVQARREIAASRSPLSSRARRGTSFPRPTSSTLPPCWISATSTRRSPASMVSSV